MNMDKQQLPPGWVEAKIDELLPPLADGKTMHQGWSPRCDGGPATSDEEWAVLKTTSIQDGEFQPQHNKKIPSHLPARPRLEVTTGDLLITSAGPRIRCGVPCLVRQTRPRLMISGKMYRFRAPQELDSVYFESVLRSPLLQKAIDEIKTGIDESGLNLTHERFRDLMIPIPPLPEQHRIVAKIEALQERSGRAAKALEEVGPLLEQFRQSILAAAFSGRLTADWRAKNPLSTEIGGEGQGEGERKGIEPAHELLARIRTERRQRWEQAELAKYEAKGKQPPKDWKGKYEEPEPVDENELPELPEGWCWASLDEISERITDGEHITPETSETGVPLLSAKDVRADEVRFDDAKYVTQTDAEKFWARCRPERGDLLIVSRGATVGRSTIVQNSNPFCLMGSVILAKLLSKEFSDFIGHFMSSEFALKNLRSASGASAQQAIYIRDVRACPIPLPPASEIAIITSSLRGIKVIGFSVHALADEASSNLTQLNQSILAKAFRGELVPQDPNDEPASELLARIRREREVSGDSVQGSGRKKKAGGKGNASESARPAKRSKRTSKAASSTTPDPSADTSPEPARPQRRRRRSSSNNEDASLVIRVLAEGGAVNIHADTSGPTVQFYTKSSGGSLLAEIEGYDDPDDTESQPHESPRTPNLRDLMTPEMALLYPDNVNPTYLPQLRTWHTWATTQIPDHFDKDRILDAKQRWSEAFEASAPSTSPRQTRKAHNGRLFDA